MEKELDLILQEFDNGNMCLDTLKAKLLLLFSVSQQREQLISFFNWYKDDPKELSNNETIVDAYLIEKFEIAIDRKRCFEVYYTDRNDKEGRIKVWVNNVDEVDDYFAQKYPHLELYDIGEC